LPFPAGESGDFDDLALWTGSVVQHGGTWQMFYTGISTLEDGAVQRIGLATSPDLVEWEKHGVVLEADPHWYETLGPGVREESWRDPWVYAAENRFHMLVTARASAGPPDGRGVIGHAQSDDLRIWQAGPPLSAPGEFFALEVPQLVELEGGRLILFSVPSEWHSAERLARSGVLAETGTHYLVARDEGFLLDRDGFLLSDPGFYGGRLLDHAGRRHFFAWRGFDEQGEFLGELSDPMPVTIGTDGSLEVGPSLLTKS
jgi:beta-fructofuranosidase